MEIVYLELEWKAMAICKRKVKEFCRCLRQVIEINEGIGILKMAKSN